MPRRMIEAPGLMYVTYYRSHMDREEGELFKVAEGLLRDDDWDMINAQTQSSPDPIFGATPDERYASVFRRVTRAVDDGGAG